jgi:pyruvate/2-oxoglutarate dehydrogenase complex dihydrolipoamide acyltransferase (E2) component
MEVETRRRVSVVSEEPFFMPKLGMQMQEATVLTWLKRAGDEVVQGDALCHIETDKVETELECEVDGSILRIEVEEGQTVPVGTVLAVITSAG